jgi:hypothetical protein
MTTTTTDRGARERQVIATVVAATLAVWVMSGWMIHDAERTAASAQVPPPLDPIQARGVAVATTGVRPAPPPARRVVVVRRSRAS